MARLFAAKDAANNGAKRRMAQLCAWFSGKMLAAFNRRTVDQGALGRLAALQVVTKRPNGSPWFGAGGEGNLQVWRAGAMRGCDMPFMSMG